MDSFDIFNLLSSNLTHVAFETFQHVQSRGVNVQQLNWVATAFRQYNETSCDKINYANWSDSNAYDAECVGGYAEIEFYAKYGGFHRNKDLAEPPGACNDYCGCQGRKCGWKFTVPCLEGVEITEYCPEETTFNTNQKETPAPTPTSTTHSPTVNPTVNTPSPTSSPTLSASPTDCLDAANTEATENSYESSLESSNESIPIKLTSVGTGSSVVFQAEQTLHSGTIPAIATLYLTSPRLTCETISNAAANSVSPQHNATCRNGNATTTLHVADTETGSILSAADTVTAHQSCTGLSFTTKIASYQHDIPCDDPCNRTVESFLAPPKETPNPTVAPSVTPSFIQTYTATAVVTDRPTYTTEPPSVTPSFIQTYTATAVVTDRPTCTAEPPATRKSPFGFSPSPPTISPTDNPTTIQTASPTEGPTSVPTSPPTTGNPTLLPTALPTVSPTTGPTGQPTITPTDGPTAGPTSSPTSGPTSGPTSLPTAVPTLDPTVLPTTSSPTSVPTSAPATNPTAGPTLAPTNIPTSGPTSGPTANPTSAPTASPTFSPVETCLPCENGEASFNMTVCNWGSGAGPWDPWAGQIVATIPDSASDTLEVTFDTAVL